MNIGIVNYGMGNLKSVYNGLIFLGHNPIYLENPLNIENIDKLILPGVGSFKVGMKNLYDSGWVSALSELVIQKGIPLLGICLGMQLLATTGFENGKSEGLNFISGEVDIMIESNPKKKIPHIGWNSINVLKETILFKDINNSSDFYFVHSYVFNPKDHSTITSTFEHGENYVSSVEHKNIYGVQFHPEKSHHSGLKLLKNFVEMS